MIGRGRGNREKEGELIEGGEIERWRGIERGMGNRERGRNREKEGG